MPWLLSGFLLVLVAAAGAYLAWPLWKHQLPDFARTALEPVMQAGRDVDLRQKVGAIETRLGEIESQMMLMRRNLAKATAVAGEQAAAERARVAIRLGAVEKSVDALGGEIAAAAGLQQRLSRLEAEVATTRAGSDTGAAAAALARRLDALEKLVRSLAAGVGPAAGAVSALRAETAETAAALQRDNKALGDAVADLTRRLAQLEARPIPAPASGGDGGLLLAVGQLRDALRGAAPFAGALDVVRALADGDAEVEKAVAVLRPDAGRGIPGHAALQESFRATAVEVARAAVAPEGGGWLDQTIARLSRVITIRRTTDGGADDTSASGLLARAEGRMEAGDLAGAVAALSRLTGMPGKAAAGWLSDANRRLDAEQALAALGARAIARRKTGG